MMFRWLRLLGFRLGWLYGLRFALMAGVMLFTFQHQARVYQLEIQMEARIPTAAVAQVFFTFDGRSHYPENSRIMLREVHEGKTRFSARISTSRPIRSIRVDPSNQTGEVFLVALTLAGPSGAQRLEGLALTQALQSVMALELLESGPAGQRMLATTNDPQMMIAVQPPLTDIPLADRWLNALTFLGWSLLIAAALEWLFQLLQPSHPLQIRAARWLGRTGHFLSDTSTIRFAPSAMLVYAVLLVLSVGWVALKLNLSSIGVWDGKYPPEHVDRYVSLGSPKAIRSDEWGVLTPWMLSQVQTGMKSDNPNIGQPGSPVLAGVPVQGLLMVANPKYWGFFLLDIERGFSWVWAFKIFGLIACFFTLLLLVTGGNTAVSLGGALGMCGASYVQWWLSSVPSETIVGFSMAVVGAVYLLQARKTGGLLFGATVVPLSVGFLLMHMYPAYLVVLAYLSVFMLAAMLINRTALQRFLLRLPLRLGLTLATLLATGLVAWLFYQEVHEAAQVMMNTAYPGRRFSTGGDHPLRAIFYGVFESWKIDDKVTPFPPTNPPEVSNFWVLFPMALVLVPFWRWGQAPYRLLASLLAFCLLCVLWMSIPMPDALRQVVAHAGWSLVPASRAQFGLAVASAILLVVLVASVERGEIQVIGLSPAWLSGAAFLLVAVFGLYLQTIDPMFFTAWRIALGAATVAAFAFVARQGWSQGFLWLSVLVALPTLHVNPLQSGLSPYLTKTIFSEARRVGGADTDRWAVYGDIQLAQGFKGAGLQVLNGTNYAPQLKLFKVLDPQADHKDVWNRYAHIELTRGAQGRPPSFEIVFADHYRIGLDVCGSHIRQAGVTRVAYTYIPSIQETACLEPLLDNHFSGVSLYKWPGQ